MKRSRIRLQQGFYRGPPLIDDEIVKKMATKLPTLEFGKWLVSNIPKEFLKMVVILIL